MMVMSVNTNSAALNALQNLNKTTSQLELTQLRINTGLEVNNAKDNAAVFAIAQNLRADSRGLDAVKDSLNRATSVLDITMTAVESIQDLLIEMKEKVVSAADEGLDAESRDALRKDFESLRDQINTMTTNATFNGTNLINSSVDNPGVPAELTAIVSPDASTVIRVPRQDIAPFADDADLAAAVAAYALDPVANPQPIVLLSSETTFNDAAEAQALIDSIDDSIKNLSQSLTIFGAGSKSIGMQRVFADKLADTIETGIGNLVDADMARESARLNSLQVKQQLGTQALSIANSQPQTILSLFNR